MKNKPESIALVANIDMSAVRLGAGWFGAGSLRAESRL